MSDTIIVIESGVPQTSVVFSAGTRLPCQKLS